LSRPARILITGASGCVGQEIAERLYRTSDAHLLLLLRDPSKLKTVPVDDPRITLLVGDLRELGPTPVRSPAPIGSSTPPPLGAIRNGPIR
jgi:nucleoside-diphosphate-sugar epimerase